VIHVQRIGAGRPGPGLRPGPPVSVTVSREILDITQQQLRSVSAGVRESMVVWAGQPLAAGAVITHVITPEVRSTRDHLTMPSATRAELAMYLRQEGLLLLADLHTHPAEAFLSCADQARPLSTRPGFYAIVVPDFAAGSAGAGWRCYEATESGWNEVIFGDRFRGRSH
jgi:proteasome lid subunit RPN8/RPN11